MTDVQVKRQLDHEVWKWVKHYSLQDQKILVALSGGSDSVALLKVLSKIHRKELLGACYFHHGEDSNQEYRKEAQVFCEQLCAQLGVKFYALKASELAKSEAQYRELRYEALERLKTQEGFVLLALGHHRDDLLETRLLRLIRGTGAQGLVAMNVYDRGLFRPLLEVSKSELVDYLGQEHLQALEDPSNQNLDPLRNWLRGEWLRALEERSSGAIGALARSLETIAQEIARRPVGDLLEINGAYRDSGILRSFYLTLSPIEQRRLLAQYLFALGKRDFSQSHLEEIQKRLDKSQKVITFKVGGCHWEVNAEQIKVQS